MMKKKIIALGMSALMMLSVGSPAFAANTSDTYFSENFKVSAINYSVTTPRREKQDKSAVYLYVTDLEDNSRVDVRAVGATDTTSKNLTENGLSGELTDHVRCKMGTQYSIHSQIKEQGYGYAKLAFKSLNTAFSELVKGCWSPDSTRSYTHATK